MLPMVSALIVMFPTTGMPRLKLSSPPFVCYYTSLRRWAEVPAEQVPKPNREDAAKMKSLVHGLEGGERARALAMPLIDALAATCGSAADFHKVADGLPADWKRGPVTRAWIASVATCLATAEPHFKMESKLVGECQKEIQGSTVLPKAWDWLDSKLGFVGLPSEIEIFVVPRYASPGAITLRTSNGVAIIVSAEQFKGTALLETVLHECIHACETLAARVDLLSQIRGSDALAKMEPNDRRNLPHTVYFIAAADAIRQGGAPKHKDVGETMGTYSRGLEPYRSHIEPIWKDYLAGKINRAKLAQGIAAYTPH
jgi:hypothetical protein